MRTTTLFLTFLATALVALPASAQRKKTDSKKTEEVSTDDKDKDKDKDAEKKTDDKATKADVSAEAGGTAQAGGETWDVTDVEELPGRSYFFIGLRYRGNIIPGFMLNMFLDEGKTVYTNQIGVEFDLRKDGFSLIPALSYHEIGTDDILFKQKNTSNIVGNYSVVNSGMKLVYATVDLLWSTKLGKNVEFEYGAGFGLGAVFGDLGNDWVREDPNGPLSASTGKHYTRCNAVDNPGTGCNAKDHQNSDVNKVGGYKEPTWFDGGSKPVVFPWIAVPQLGLRFKPVKNFVGRLGIGFALTGFWFGLNAEYGLEKKRPD